MLEQISSCYDRIANRLLEWDNIVWESIAIIANKDSEHNSLGIYFKDKTYVLAQDLIRDGILNENTFYDYFFDIDDIISEMKDIFVNNDQEEWHKFVMKITKEGRFETKYSYELVKENAFEEQIIDEYKYLNILPQNDFEKYIVGVDQELI